MKLLLESSDLQPGCRELSAPDITWSNLTPEALLAVSAVGQCFYKSLDGKTRELVYSPHVLLEITKRLHDLGAI